MGVILATAVGLVIWIVLWALGAKGIDAFLPAVVIIFAAVGAKMVLGGAPEEPGS